MRMAAVQQEKDATWTMWSWAIEETLPNKRKRIWQAPMVTEKEARDTAELWRSWGIKCHAIPQNEKKPCLSVP